MRSDHEKDLLKYVADYLSETSQIAACLDWDCVGRIIDILANLKGRLFIIGVGGSAANASHAVNDFRKICGIEAYTPTDNVAELTARTNDDGWASTFTPWLKVSHLSPQDIVLVLSVGGGSYTTSPNIMAALMYAKVVGATILGIAGRDGGYTSSVADACLLIPTINPDRITPHVEELQSIILHLIVNHPSLRR